MTAPDAQAGGLRRPRPAGEPPGGHPSLAPAQRPPRPSGGIRTSAVAAVATPGHAAMSYGVNGEGEPPQYWAPHRTSQRSSAAGGGGGSRRPSDLSGDFGGVDGGPSSQRTSGAGVSATDFASFAPIGAGSGSGVSFTGFATKARPSAVRDLR